MTILQPTPGNSSNTSISIEESKFLGGDVQHTHLVKGLDFALLKKVRSDLDQQQAEEAAKAKQAQIEAIEKAEVQSARARTAVAKGLLLQVRLGRLLCLYLFRSLDLGRALIHDWCRDRSSRRQLHILTQ